MDKSKFFNPDKLRIPPVFFSISEMMPIGLLHTMRFIRSKQWSFRSSPTSCLARHSRPGHMALKNIYTKNHVGQPMWYRGYLPFLRWKPNKFHRMCWKHTNFHECAAGVKILMFQLTRWHIFDIYWKKVNFLFILYFLEDLRSIN